MDDQFSFWNKVWMGVSLVFVTGFILWLISLNGS